MVVDRLAPESRARHVIRRWELWALPGEARLLLVAIEAAACLLATVGIARAHPTATDLRRLLLMAVLSLVLANLVNRVEQSHRRLADGPTVDAASVWIFAGALLLPAGYAALLSAVIYAHTLVHRRNDRAWQPHRIVVAAATMVLAALAASATFQSARQLDHLPAGAAPAVGVLAAMAAYRIVNDVLIAAIIYLAARPPRLRDVLLKPDDRAVEIAMMILGAFTAQAIIQMPWLTPAVLVLIVVMYRGLLVKKLEVAATTDGKTGLLNATAWRALAQRHLWRAIREDQAAAMLMIDLDRFKALNDQHGHLVGDLALKAVAESLKHELRDYDAVGRYGGEEFAVMLPNAGSNAGMRVAERLRQRIEACAISDEGGQSVPLTGSIGVATHPTHGAALDELIRAADAALYAAKAAGRNAVRLADGARATSASSQGTRPAHA
jgi:diguanylate cyclase (GGDEF)-like protein